MAAQDPPSVGLLSYTGTMLGRRKVPLISFGVEFW
jgi:hypothetical protein